MQKINFKRTAIGTAALLSIPLVCTLLAIGGFNWGVGDFILMGVLLFGTGVAIEFAVKKITDRKFRIAACISIVGVLLLIWSELAVDAVSTVLKNFI